MATALTLFDRFGGVRPMASVLEERPSTVQGWKDNGRIPSTKQPLVLRRGEQLGLEISAEDVVFPLGRDVEADPSARIPTRLEALQWAIDEAGSEEALARMCGANVTDVWKWVQIRQAPREYVIAIECGTGVPREYLRPDIFPIKDASKLKPWKPKPARRGRRPAAVVNG